MKNLKLLLLISAGLCFAGIASAQRHYSVGCTIDGPSHPLKPAFGQPRVLADTVVVRTYTEMRHQPMYPLLESTYKFHENNRIDTVCSYTEWTILKYSDKGLLLSNANYIPRHQAVDGTYMEPRELLDVEFEYGEDGRLVKTIDYTFDEDSVYVDSVYTYNYTMTDSGYIMTDHAIEYILDDQGRITYIKDLSSKDEYVYDPEGRKFRIGDTYYFYFDNGFRSLIYSHRGIIELGAPDAWSRMDYFFQENGYMSKNIDYLKEEGETEWTVYNDYRYEYYYRADNPLANIAIKEQPDGKVYATAGAVVIETETAAMVSVYSFSGQLVTQQRIADGINRIALSKGLYIIVINDKGYKVVVK